VCGMALSPDSFSVAVVNDKLLLSRTAIPIPLSSRKQPLPQLAPTHQSTFSSLTAHTTMYIVVCAEKLRVAPNPHLDFGVPLNPVLDGLFLRK